MKQTAVEWLFEEMSNIHSGAKVYVNANKKIVEQAKAMEKEQRRYSEEDMKEYSNYVLTHIQSKKWELPLSPKEWFKQFKNKGL